MTIWWTSDWSDTPILHVVTQSLEVHRSGSGVFTIGGPDVALGSGQAIALSMALHELATNALKYGALSQDGGRIDVRWAIGRPKDSTTPDQTDVFRFSWTERGGPPVSEPTRSGFGRQMIERALAGYFGGTSEITFDPEGVQFILQAPGADLATTISQPNAG